MSKLLAVLNVLGMLLMVFSSICILPVVTALLYEDGTVDDFLYAWVVIFGTGASLTFFTRRFKRELKGRDGILLVTLYWTMTAALSTLPLLRILPDLSFTDAYFEAMSGLSTTGATVLGGLDHIAPAVNLWRHALNWFGGMGIIVLAVAVLPLIGVGGMQLYRAEIAGPVKDDKLTPRITETAKTLWLVYVGITAACIVSLRAAGMSWFDAVCHAFSALSLGGFSTHDASIGFFDSPAIEIVLIIFMTIAAMNFAMHFVAIKTTSIKVYLQNAEVIVLMAMLILSSLFCATFLQVHNVYPEFPTALRHVTFNLVSLATDCGFVSVDYALWPAFVPLWMLFLSCICANSGSTGGGIKMFRTLLLWQQTGREMLKLVHPSSVLPVRAGNVVVPNRIVFAVLAFIFVYFMTVVILTFTLMVSGLDFLSAFTGILASVNNAGPGLNQVGPATNYAGLSNFQTWICSLAMLLGRLEVFTCLVLFTPAFWRK